MSELLHKSLPPDCPVVTVGDRNILNVREFMREEFFSLQIKHGNDLQMYVFRNNLSQNMLDEFRGRKYAKAYYYPMFGLCSVVFDMSNPRNRNRLTSRSLMMLADMVTDLSGQGVIKSRNLDIRKNMSVLDAFSDVLMRSSRY